jgi:hypothetical protein
MENLPSRKRRLGNIMPFQGLAPARLSATIASLPAFEAMGRGI